MLAAEGLVVARAGRRVLDGASLAVSAREIAVIEGPSGGGKTTLLRALAMLIDKEAGRITLDGVDASTVAPREYRTRVAYVLQQPPMLDGTVGDNVRAGPRLRGIELADAAVDALLSRAALDAGFRPRPASELSGGEKQRVAIARALANEPRVILLDEPTSALDSKSAKRVLELVTALAAEGLAVILVTHEGEQAATLAATRYLCESGRLQRRGAVP